MEAFLVSDGLAIAPRSVGGGAVACLAPAKVNLWLRITGRRDDGFHWLDSLVAFTSVADEVRVSPAATPTFRVTGPFGADVPSAPSENLVWRAADLMAERAGRHRSPLAIHLKKNLPVAAGIGGGSADAAAVIRCLQHLWHLTLTAEDRDRIAGLGADIPMCVASEAAYVSGIGEELEPGPMLSGAALVLVNPGVPVSTPDVFKARTGPFSAPTRRPDIMESGTGVRSGAQAPELMSAISSNRNDLAEAAMSICPEIGVVIRSLQKRPGLVHAGVSGSGATCFGLFDNGNHADLAAAAISRESPGWWCRAGSVL